MPSPAFYCNQPILRHLPSNTSRSIGNARAFSLRQDFRIFEMAHIAVQHVVIHLLLPPVNVMGSGVLLVP